MGNRKARACDRGHEVRQPAPSGSERIRTMAAVCDVKVAEATYRHMQQLQSYRVHVALSLTEVTANPDL